MQAIIDGETAVVTVQAKDEAGTLIPIAGWTVAAAWHSVTGATPPAANVTATDANTWTASASSAGLGGRSLSLRVTATNPVSGRVYIEDALYLIKA
jgi:hypothetical protein